jgi:hypothetical protein
MKLTEDQASKVWDLLVNIGGARKDWHDMFVRHATNDLVEFRFQGHLGFGGKIYGASYRVFVDCYHDEHTPERDRIIAEINAGLKELGLP